MSTTLKANDNFLYEGNWMVKRINVMEKDWDYLIILDACRYDYFSEIFPKYFQGELRKVISQGSSTIEWCRKSFKEMYDNIIYVSANPFINSKIEVQNFNAKEHFYKVVDVWDWGWNDQLGTVHPRQVNEAVHKFKESYPDKRFIIHYLQPHEPYLVQDLDCPGFSKPKLVFGRLTWGAPGLEKEGKIATLLTNSPVVQKFLNFLAKKMGGDPSWKLREILNHPALPTEVLKRNVGISGLRKAYAENLKLVLSYVAKLVKSLSGAIIVTADHGERLGEGNSFSHYPELLDPLLIEVPWLKITAKE
jgi:hypothetical protein